MSDEEKKYVHIINDEGATMMTMQKMGREGDQMTVEGSLMGAWVCTMYINPEETLRMIRLLCSWTVISYMLSLPFILLKRRFKKKPKKA
ncbi:MAG: hypothetical protein A4E53_00020 [Pelotomaculum sp. PtaB.Bin104]|nr:MAG: hypothetical protein A4E53_00020 [Pelotomaculum sp. PtaB.Bin104]